MPENQRTPSSPYCRDTSPVGWYVGSYLIRFVELDATGNDDAEGEFLVWENTIIVRAESFDEAYKKVEAKAMLDTETYEGGPEGVPVRWIFEGISNLIPIYEPLEDGAEIMWSEHAAMKLGKLRSMVSSVDALRGDAKDAERATLK
ncbi:DUF4288 domain-containing protein [Dyella acidiphila]|uniref:DUF4288 domain-containing protein n=1 Tax=Dyella acidiphila TaxID=2775866 RepID=A0ABR9GEB9_9GAMM|nr:DUF4288 domain-containing protein [Dyella acidiphila]MBE1162366.1 DUF4288 domain-containing protein [Dyella acidiphila]